MAYNSRSKLTGLGVVAPWPVRHDALLGDVRLLDALLEFPHHREVGVETLAVHRAEPRLQRGELVAHRIEHALAILAQT